MIFETLLFETLDYGSWNIKDLVYKFISYNKKNKTFLPLLSKPALFFMMTVFHTMFKNFLG